MNHDEWIAWKRDRILSGQRTRRSKLRRIDYQDVSDEAGAFIDAECFNGAGGDYSSVLNRIVVEWADALGSGNKWIDLAKLPEIIGTIKRRLWAVMA